MYDSIHRKRSSINKLTMQPIIPARVARKYQNIKNYYNEAIDEEKATTNNGELITKHPKSNTIYIKKKMRYQNALIKFWVKGQLDMK